MFKTRSSINVKMECEKIILKFLTILVLLTVNVGSVDDYCLIQRVSCGTNKHVGCYKNIFNNTDKPRNIHPISSRIKEIILNELNMYRSDVAMGKYENRGLPKSSNMRSLRWNNNFAHLADLLIKAFPFFEFSSCIATDKFHNPMEIHLHLNNSKAQNDEEIFRSALRNITSGTAIKSSKSKLGTQYFIASNYQIGAALASRILENGNGYEYIMKFVQNSWYVDDIKDAYKLGTPCSKCSMWNEVCDDSRYPGLCVPKKETNQKHQSYKKGEKGDRGERGLTGVKPVNIVNDQNQHHSIQNDDSGYISLRTKKSPTINILNNDEFHYSISFWILYVILAFGVLITNLMSFTSLIKTKSTEY